MTVEQLIKNENGNFIVKRSGTIVDPIEIGDVVNVVVMEDDITPVSVHYLNSKGGFLDYAKPDLADSYFVIEKEDANDGTNRIRCRIQYCRIYGKEGCLKAIKRRMKTVSIST